MVKIRLSTTEILGVGSILLGPMIAVFVPSDRTIQFLSKTIGLKDFSFLILLFTLGFSIIFVRIGRRISDWLQIDSFYRSAEYNYFFSEDGTVITRNKFELVNGWHFSAVLPEEDLLWYAPISEQNMIYRLFERGQFRDRRISHGENGPKIDPIAFQRMPGDDTNYRYRWRPIISPSLARKERISYIAEIIARGTETEAFERKGTNFGFGLSIRCHKAVICGYAPFGYKFVLINPQFSIRDSETLQEIGSGKFIEPIVSPDGTMLTLTVNRPKPNKRYWVHYRFEKVDD